MTGTDLAMPVLTGERVLVVEAGEDAAASLTAVLRLNGFNAKAVTTGTAAVAAVAAIRPRVVVLDLGLPDADGCEVIRRVRGGEEPPAVVVVTGQTAADARRDAEAAGAVGYLLKPADPHALVTLVRNLCVKGNE
jgi:DNA-binding response OmpR family regulator